MNVDKFYIVYTVDAETNEFDTVELCDTGTAACENLQEKIGGDDVYTICSNVATDDVLTTAREWLRDVVESKVKNPNVSVTFGEVAEALDMLEACAAQIALNAANVAK